MDQMLVKLPENFILKNDKGCVYPLFFKPFIQRNKVFNLMTITYDKKDV